MLDNRFRFLIICNSLCESLLIVVRMLEFMNVYLMYDSYLNFLHSIRKCSRNLKTSERRCRSLSVIGSLILEDCFRLEGVGEAEEELIEEDDDCKKEEEFKEFSFDLGEFNAEVGRDLIVLEDFLVVEDSSDGSTKLRSFDSMNSSNKAILVFNC